MSYSIDSIKREIANYIQPNGEISSSKYVEIQCHARNLGLNDDDLNSLVRAVKLETRYGNSTLFNKENKVKKNTMSKQLMIIILGLFITVLIVSSIFIFNNTNNTSSDNFSQSQFIGMKNKPIEPDELKTIFGGIFQNKSILISVTDIVCEEGKYFFVCDIKCDFIPINKSRRVFVDLEKRIFDFLTVDTFTDDIQFGRGALLRTGSGKIVLKSDDGSFEFIQM
ncbi:MAG: hypothetical protein MJ211_06445 [Bacteroidales bacterium]|nr:hypothetical protein [Bacteroidales bacterium]